MEKLQSKKSMKRTWGVSDSCYAHCWWCMANGWYHPFLPWLPIAQAVPQAVPLARLLPTAGRCHRGDCEGEIGWNWCKMLVYVGKTHVWEWTGITLISFCQLGFGIACLFRSEHMLFCQLGLLWVVGLQLFLTKLSSGPMLWFWVLRFCFLVPGIWGGPRCCQFLTLH